MNNKIFKFRFWQILIVTTLLISGCVKKSPYEYFNEGRFLEAKEAYKPLLPKDESHKDYTLHRLQYGSCALEGGDYRCADACMDQCWKKMEKVSGQGEASAVIAMESLKEYKGDPFEKAMCNTYCGLARLRNNDPERALISFRKALVDDQGTRTKKTDETKDFATAHYFAGLCYNMLNEPENAKVELKLAGQYSSPCEFFQLDKVNNSNCFFMISSGRGPFKSTYGPGHSMVQVNKVKDPVAKIIFTCDGREMGQAALLDDLYVEAHAHGWGEMDSARLAKGIAKEIVASLPVVGAAHNLIQSAGDIRIWNFLPGNIYIWSGNLDSGFHTFAFHCYDIKGEHLPEYDQAWFYMPVYGDRTNIMNFRLVPYRQDIKEKVLVPCSALSINK